MSVWTFRPAWSGSVLVVSALCLAPGCGEPGGKFQAATTAGQFDQALADPGQPVLLEFYKFGCPACMLLAPTLAELSAEYAGRAAFVKVERSQVADRRRQYGIRGYPTVLLFVRGQERARWVNQGSKDVYRKALDAALVELSSQPGSPRP